MSKAPKAEQKSFLRLQEIRGKGEAVGEITAWLASSAEARAKFRIRTDNLADTPRARWNKKQFRHIEGKLWEIKWKAEDKEWRAFGFDHEGFFVMVLGGFHLGKAHEPRNWKATALTRIAEVTNGQWTRIEFIHIKEEKSNQGTS